MLSFNRTLLILGQKAWHHFDNSPSHPLLVKLLDNHHLYPGAAVPTNNVYDMKPHWAVDFLQTVNARNTGMETVQKEAQNVLVMMDINTLKRKTNVLVRIMPCY